MHEVDGNDSLCNTIKGQQQWMATDGPRAINGLPDISGPPDCSEVICLILIVQPLIRDRVTGAASPEGGPRLPLPGPHRPTLARGYRGVPRPVLRYDLST